MFINFDGFGFNFHNTMNERVIIEIQIGNQIIERGQVPMMFAKQQFGQMCMNVAKAKTPMQVKCIKDDYTEEGKKIENSLAFQNNLFVKNFDSEGETNVEKPI